MNFKRKAVLGVTLIEILLVLVIIGTMIYLGMGYIQQRTLQMRTDRASLQMQQILNAGLAYYVANGRWPSNIGCLQASGGSGCTQRYLPNNLLSPWGQTYTAVNNNANFYVYTAITTATPAASLAAATIIAGQLPMSYVTRTIGATPPAINACTGVTCYPVGSVTIPGQNLNNASAVNFAGLYHHGACVPVPQCPTDANGNTMQPQVFVVPVSVSGATESGSIKPISSFTAYAVGGTSTSPPICTNGGAISPSCGAVASGSSAYWRACLQVITPDGDIAQIRGDMWGGDVTMAAFTRCAITGEPSGSNFSVFAK